MRRAKSKKFEKLKQTPNMIVTKYDIQFIYISHYALHLLSLKRIRIDRLVKPLYKAMAP